MSRVEPALSLTVLGEIASGGMGVVELARLEDGAGERLVAVKRMHPEYARDQEFVRMFRDEIWLTGSLQHPNVVGLVGWGDDEDGPYLVMEYVDGVSLGRIALAGRRAGDPMPPELVAFVAARTAEGLHAAHTLVDDAGRRLDIVHRDVTPSNILVGFDGCVKITDFGIAKATGKSSHTRTGIIKGKIAYMSPEYAARRPVDGRADLYSLGVVLFELLAGEVPFDARGDLELLKLVAYATAPSLSSRAPHVDPALGAIVDRLLCKSPAERHADGAELARALDAWLETHHPPRDVLQRSLGDYARRYAGTTRRKLASLLDEEASAVRERGNAPTRRRVETRTFTAFRPQPPRERDAEARPGTRRVALSGYPPPPALEAPPASTPALLEVALEAAPRFSQPPAPAMARARQASAVLGGVIAGSVVALALVVLSVLATRDDHAEPSPGPVRAAAPATSVEPSPPRAQPAESPPAPSSDAPAAAAAAHDQPGPSAPPSAVPAGPAAAVPGPARAGKPRAQPARVPSSIKGTRPCTPDSFDYPGCLKR